MSTYSTSFLLIYTPLAKGNGNFSSLRLTPLPNILTLFNYLLYVLLLMFYNNF